MSNLVAEGIGSDILSLGQYEQSFNEGEQGELRVYIGRNLSGQELVNLENEIIRQEVLLTEPIVQDARVVFIGFEKRIAPLLIIAGAVVAVIGGILGWQVFKTIQAGIPLWALLAGSGVLLYLLSRR